MRVSVPVWMLVVCFPAFAQAQTWSSDTSLMAAESPAMCSQFGNVTYAFEISGNALTGTVVGHGRAFTAPLAADGNVKHEFTTPAGNRLEISGNANTRDLALRNLNSGCRWKLTPKR